MSQTGYKSRAASEYRAYKSNEMMPPFYGFLLVANFKSEIRCSHCQFKELYN